MSINEKMTAIADKIRSYCGFTRKLGLDDMAENIDAVYNFGTQNGKDTAYDEFWDSFQQNGARRNYTFGFAGVCWTDDTYNPKYPIIVTNIANSMFSYNTTITSTKVPLTIDTANGTNVFLGCSRLAQIPSITVTSKAVFTQWFSGCSSLKEIRFTEDSVIANSLSLSSCPLSYESIINIIGVLKDFRTTQSYDCSFNKFDNAAPPNFVYGEFYEIIDAYFDLNYVCFIVPENDILQTVQIDGINPMPNEINEATHIAFDESGESITLKFPASSATKTLTLGEESINKLSESEKLLIAEKGWTLA